jgi:hypothetical protein
MPAVSRFTAPFRASALPAIVAPVFMVIVVSAITFPTIALPVPSVAELPTTQNTLQLEPPPVKTTRELAAVVSVLPIWKIQTSVGPPLRVSVPVNWADEVNL